MFCTKRKVWNGSLFAPSTVPRVDFLSCEVFISHNTSSILIKPYTWDERRKAQDQRMSGSEVSLLSYNLLINVSLRGNKTNHFDVEAFPLHSVYTWISHLSLQCSIHCFPCYFYSLVFLDVHAMHDVNMLGVFLIRRTCILWYIICRGIPIPQSYEYAWAPIRSLPLGVSVITKPDPGNLPSGHCHRLPLRRLALSVLFTITTTSYQTTCTVSERTFNKRHMPK